MDMISRIRQKLSESIHNESNRTSYHSSYLNQTRQAELTRDFLVTFVKRVKSVIQPDSAIRNKDRLLPETTTKYEDLAEALKQAESIDTKKFQQSMELLSTAQNKLSEAEKQYITQVDYFVLQPFQKFCDEDHIQLENAIEELEAARLDMDATKSRIMRAGNRETLAELDVKMAAKVKNFDEKAAVVKRLLDKYPQHHEAHRKLVREFLKAQIGFHDAASAALRHCYRSF